MTTGPDPRDGELLASLVEEPSLEEGFLDAVAREWSGEWSRPYFQLRPSDRGVADFPLRSAAGAIRVTAATGVEAARLLAETVRYGSVADRRQAHMAISQIIHTVVEPYTGRVVNQPSAFAVLARLEGRLRRSRAMVPPLVSSPQLGGVWTAVGFLVTVVAGAAIVGGHYLAAALLVAARTAVSLTMPTPGLPSDTATSDERQVDRRVDWRACVVGQVTDAVALSAVSVHLFLNGEAGWAMASAAVPLMSLGATILRLAAAQGGVVLGRLYIERVARNGGLVAGLLAAAAFERSGGAAPVVALASAGAAVFAVVEAVRTHVYAKSREQLDRRAGSCEAFAKRVAGVVPLVDAVVYGARRNDRPHRDVA